MVFLLAIGFLFCADALFAQTKSPVQQQNMATQLSVKKEAPHFTKAEAEARHKAQVANMSLEQKAKYKAALQNSKARIEAALQTTQDEATIAKYQAALQTTTKRLEEME